MTIVLSKKTRIEISIRVFQILPRRCRSGGSPVPFSNGWMTVAAASDFQSRPVMFCGRPSLLVSSNSGSGITPRNLEHRRVNIQRAVGRELREKHWFSSQPSTNGSLFSKNYSRSVAPSSRFSRSRIFACTAVTSSFVSVRFFARYVNLYASDFPEAVAVASFVYFKQVE